MNGHGCRILEGKNGRYTVASKISDNEILGKLACYFFYNNKGRLNNELREINYCCHPQESTIL